MDYSSIIFNCYFDWNINQEENVSTELMNWGIHFLNKDYAGAVAYILLVLFAGVLIAEFFTATRDESWINEVEIFIKEENWVPNSEYVPMQDWAFFLYENGEDEYFYLESQSEFITFINNMLNRINRQVENSLSEELLDEILATNKVLELVHRFSTRSMGWIPTNNFDWNVDYRIAYFVLEDTLETSLEGTIIVRETNSKIRVWQIKKSSIW
jgi:hypothetical protein